MATNRDKEVEKLAYKLYEQSGRVQGRDREHWLEAERVLMARKPATAKKIAAKGIVKAGKKVIESARAAGAKVREKTGLKAAKAVEKPIKSAKAAGTRTRKKAGRKKADATA